jgi:hypothetical protein
MTSRIKWYRRRLPYGVALAGLIAVAVPMAQAGDGGGPVTVTMERHASYSDCPQNLPLPHFDSSGKAILTRSGNIVTVTIHSRGADPNRNVDLWLFYTDGVTCGDIGFLGRYKTSPNGSGDKTGSTDISGYEGYELLVFTYYDNYNTTDASAPVKL